MGVVHVNRRQHLATSHQMVRSVLDEFSGSCGTLLVCTTLGTGPELDYIQPVTYIVKNGVWRYKKMTYLPCTLWFGGVRSPTHQQHRCLSGHSDLLMHRLFWWLLVVATPNFSH